MTHSQCILKNLPITDHYENHKTTTIPVINTPQTKSLPQMFPKYLAAAGTLKNYSNMALLVKISLLIPPSTSNVEHRFSVMTLLCTLLRSSLSETNLDQFMKMCLNGPNHSQTLSVKNS